MLTSGNLLPVLGLSLSLLAGCGGAGNSSDSYDTEVATSAVSGAMNNNTGTTVGWNLPTGARPSLFARVVSALSPIRDAWAATWTCSGGSLSPIFAGPGSYAYTPVSCSVTWGNNQTVSAKWSGSFSLVYGAQCDTSHPLASAQAAGCTITRTTAVGGNSRSIIGPDGSSYSVIADTNGAGSGWDAKVSPAPSNGGSVLSCGVGGCAAAQTLVINGSHLRGTVTVGSNGSPITFWDHTVSTGATGLTVTGSGPGRSVSGAVTVQHNLLKYTTTAAFNNVTFGNAGCCFPTSGSVSATFSSGTNAGKTETLSFSAVCGEATLTTASGLSKPYTLQHCM